MSLVILLSPSKTQEPGANRDTYSLPEYTEKTETLVKGLKKFGVDELSRLMAISEKLAISTHKRFSDFHFPPTPDHCRQALLAFRGDVFSEIEADSYNEEDWTFAQNHLRILSGLYGILRPLDLIQPYRLEMGGKFSPQNCKNLYEFWRADITQSINKTLSTQQAEVVLNLASLEYFKAVEAKKLTAPVANAFFKQRKNGRLRTVAIHAKKARGALTNFILKNKVNNLSDLKDFSYNGYVYDRETSTASDLQYIQE